MKNCNHKWLYLSHEKVMDGMDGKGIYSEYNVVFYCNGCQKIKGVKDRAYFDKVK